MMLEKNFRAICEGVGNENGSCGVVTKCDLLGATTLAYGRQAAECVVGELVLRAARIGHARECMLACAARANGVGVGHCIRAIVGRTQEMLSAVVGKSGHSAMAVGYGLNQAAAVGELEALSGRVSQGRE